MADNKLAPVDYLRHVGKLLALNVSPRTICCFHCLPDLPSLSDFAAYISFFEAHERYFQALVAVADLF